MDKYCRMADLTLILTAYCGPYVFPQLKLTYSPSHWTWAPGLYHHRLSKWNIYKDSCGQHMSTPVKIRVYKMKCVFKRDYKRGRKHMELKGGGVCTVLFSVHCSCVNKIRGNAMTLHLQYCYVLDIPILVQQGIYLASYNAIKHAQVRFKRTLHL